MKETLKKKISIVVPCYNEEKNVEFAYKEISAVLKNMSAYNYEILFIDNCSEDKTADILRKLAKNDKNVKVILNNRNFGPEQSSFYALTQSTGDAVIGLPCDLQDPPALIPNLVKEWDKGAKVVFGQKLESDENKLMYFFRTIYYKIIKMLSPLPQYDQAASLGLLDRKVIKEAAAMRDPWPLVRNIVPQLGYVPVLLPYKQKARERGHSSYNLIKYFDTALSSLVHTSKIPMKAAIWVGSILAILSFMTGCFYLVYKLCYWNSFTIGQAPIVIMLCFLTSILLIFLGILGEYLLAVLDRISFHGYVIEKERINFDDTKNN